MVTMKELKESIVWDYLYSKEEAECFIEALNEYSINIDLDNFIDGGRGLSIDWAIIKNNEQSKKEFIKEYNDSRFNEFSIDDFIVYETKDYVMYIDKLDVAYFDDLPKIKGVDLDKKREAIGICDLLNKNGYIFKLNERYLDDGVDFIKIFCRHDVEDELVDLFVLNGFDAKLNYHGNIVVDFACEFPRLSMSECFSNKK